MIILFKILWVYLDRFRIAGGQVTKQSEKLGERRVYRQMLCIFCEVIDERVEGVAIDNIMNMEKQLGTAYQIGYISENKKLIHLF